MQLLWLLFLNPILPSFGTGSGSASCLSACIIAAISLSCVVVLFSRSVSRFMISVYSRTDCRKATNARTMNTLTSAALFVFSTDAAIIAPCSVKAYGKALEYLSLARWSQFATSSDFSFPVVHSAILCHNNYYTDSSKLRNISISENVLVIYPTQWVLS